MFKDDDDYDVSKVTTEAQLGLIGGTRHILYQQGHILQPWSYQSFCLEPVNEDETETV